MMLEYIEKIMGLWLLCLGGVGLFIGNDATFILLSFALIIIGGILFIGEKVDMIKWEKIRKNKKFVNKDKSMRLEVGKEGFCLWVKEDKVWHWVLDASKILETMELDISMDTLWTQDLLGRKERTGMSITDTRLKE